MGTPMKQARHAIENCLANLSPEDQFGIVTFDSTVDEFCEEMLPATHENNTRVTMPRMSKASDSPISSNAGCKFSCWKLNQSVGKSSSVAPTREQTCPMR